MTYLVVVDTDENKITKFQDYESESEANAHATRVADTFPNAFVAQVDADYLVDYMVADVSNKTVTFDQVRWDSDQNAITSTQYSRDRKAEYDQLNQFEMMFDDKRDGSTTWVDKINEIKSRYPKGVTR